MPPKRPALFRVPAAIGQDPRAARRALCRMTRVLLPGLCLTGNLAGCAAVSPLAIPTRDSGSVEGDLGCTLSIARHRLLLVGLASGRPRWAGAEQLGELHPGPVQAFRTARARIAPAPDRFPAAAPLCEVMRVRVSLSRGRRLSGMARYGPNMEAASHSCKPRVGLSDDGQASICMHNLCTSAVDSVLSRAFFKMGLRLYRIIHRYDVETTAARLYFTNTPWNFYRAIPSRKLVRQDRSTARLCEPPEELSLQQLHGRDACHWSLKSRLATSRARL
jgi:hypothetical protein